MSERMPSNESGKENLDLNYDQSHEKRAAERIEKEAERSKHEHQERLEEVRKKIEKEAQTRNEAEMDKAQETKFEPASPISFSKELSSQSLKKNLSKVQRNLSKPEKTFSKIVHNPLVDFVSETGEKTIARPSGLLFGGVFGFLGNLAILIICRYYGYEYNYLIGIVSFGGGFIFGLIVEAAYKTIFRK